MKQSMTPIIGKIEMPDDELEQSIKDHKPFLTVHHRIGLNDSQLSELSQLLGRNIADADDLLLAARNMTTLSIDGLEGGDITLDSYLLNRLRSRCPTNVDFGGFVRDRVKELLAGYCGA